MKLVGESQYRGYTLMLLESRVHEKGAQPERHWLVIAPDGLNVVGKPQSSSEEARAFIDSLVGPASPPDA